MKRNWRAILNKRLTALATAAAWAAWPALAAAAGAETAHEFWRLSVRMRVALWALGWTAGSFLACKIVSTVWRRVLLPVARRTRTRLDWMMLENTRVPVQWTVFAIGVWTGARAMAAEFSGLDESFVWKIVSGIAYVALVLTAALTVHAAARGAMDWYSEEIAKRTDSRIDDQFVAIGRKISKFVFLFLALTIIFEHFGVRVTGLLATAGVASLAVALAAQETLSNMIAGFVLLIDRPFRAGDRVELANGKVGDVIEVGLRTTRILSFDNTVLSIPNAEIAKNQIVNYNAPNPRFKIRRTVSVAYGSDIRKVKRVLLEILNGHPAVLKDPAPEVFFTDFGESSLNLLYVCWVEDYRQQFRIRDEINMAIKDRFEAEGIEIPFPQRDVHVRGDLAAWGERVASSRKPPGL